VPSGLFVTGTDTGVGKTVVCAALMHRFRETAPLRYWKPIQTGIEQDDDTAEVTRLGACDAGACDAEEVDRDGVRLARPVSPHLAARLSGQTIDVPSIAARTRAGTARGWIIEGAGGVLVPLNDRETNVDLMIAIGLPALVVSRTALGTINHTLLTLEALRRRSVPVAGVVMVGDPNPENRTAIEQYGGVAVLGEMPRLPAIAERNSPRDLFTLAQWAREALDAEGRLMQWLH
jgi:dethiobiotin synthase